MIDTIMAHSIENPISHSVWIPKMYLKRCSYDAYLYSVLYEWIPYILLDFILYLANYKFRLD